MIKKNEERNEEGKKRKKWTREKEGEKVKYKIQKNIK